MNAGKSALFNALTGQTSSIVDKTPGTTTDPVRKIFEIEGSGPVTLIDTGGIDDEKTPLGRRRVKKAAAVTEQIDLAILVFTDNVFGVYEQKLADSFRKKKIPFFLVHGKNDLTPLKKQIPSAETAVFSIKNPGKEKIFSLIKKHLAASSAPKNLLDGLVQEGEEILLVTPIDASAPEGRLILPQVQTLRAALDKNAVTIVAQPAQLKNALKNKNFKLVITDSQVFAEVAKIVPQKTPLTSFSMLLAHAHANFADMVKGAKKLDGLKDGDKILILESCTHTINSCIDIGRVKIPALIKKYTGKKLDFTVVAGLDALPEDLSSYALAVQCGGCMATERQLANRLGDALDAGLAITNYGMAIAYCNGIFDRVLKSLL